MFIRIERGSSSPISRQIAEQIRAQCLAGVLKPGSTEAIREEVKQILLPMDFAIANQKPDGLLDVRRFDDRLAITTDKAIAYIHKLSANGVSFDVVDLRLDEIFEAFVIGRTQDWLSQSMQDMVSV